MKLNSKIILLLEKTISSKKYCNFATCIQPHLTMRDHATFKLDDFTELGLEVGLDLDGKPTLTGTETILHWPLGQFLLPGQPTGGYSLKNNLTRVYNAEAEIHHQITEVKAFQLYFI